MKGIIIKNSTSCFENGSDVLVEHCDNFSMHTISQNRKMIGYCPEKEIKSHSSYIPINDLWKEFERIERGIMGPNWDDSFERFENEFDTWMYWFSMRKAVGNYFLAGQIYERMSNKFAEGELLQDIIKTEISNISKFTLSAFERENGAIAPLEVKSGLEARLKAKQSI